MRCDAVGKPCCISPRSRAIDKIGIDVERVHMSRWSYAVRQLDGGVARPASEIGDHVSPADIRWGVEGLSGRCPLIHAFVACQALRADLEPVLQEQVLVRHSRDLQR